MLPRSFTLLLLIIVLSPSAQSKDKPKALPAQVLHAETIFVVINPNAGEPLTDPNANSLARENVEKALMQWGRFRLVMVPINADLILSVRTGRGKTVRPVINGSPTDNRPIIVEPGGEGAIRIGAQQGRPPDVISRGPSTGPHVGTEVGSSEDTLELYLGGVESSLDSPPIWRYSAKDALRPPKIPAIDQLKKSHRRNRESTSEDTKALRRLQQEPGKVCEEIAGRTR